jgi:hypothetical protein
MMNDIVLQSTEFINRPQGTSTFGWRIYDNYSQAYDNSLDSLVVDDLVLLQLALDSEDNNVVDMLDFLHEHGQKIEINGTIYSWDEIKRLMVWDKE